MASTSSPSPVTYQWPRNHYRQYWRGAAAIRLLGTDTVKAMPVRAVAFVRPDLPAWFRLYIDDAGRVRRQDMLTAGYLMRHDYGDFETAGPITPPLSERIEKVTCEEPSATGVTQLRP